MKLFTFLLGFGAGFVLGAYGYKWYLEHKEETIYDFGDSTPPVQNESKVIHKEEVFKEVSQDALEHPQDSDEDEDYMDEDTQKRFEEGRRLTNEYYENRDLPPRILSVDEIGDLPSSVDHQIVKYYVNDTLMAFEDSNEVIENEPYYFGDLLQEYCDNDNMKTIFVMNYRLNTLYEVTKTDEDYYI